MIFNITGTSKMKIIAFSDTSFSQKAGEMVVQLNPDKYSLDYEVLFSNSQTPGSSGQELLFDRIKPQKLIFEFLFDRTGAISNSVAIPGLGGLLSLGGENKNGVQPDIDNLRKITMGFDGDLHRTKYLILNWGKLLFKCCLTKMNITYKLFRPDGTPLRASAKCYFEEFRETELRLKEENKNSPDLTHIRTVKEGDSLPLMTYRIYGDSKYYLQVAKVNEIENFRNLEVGQQVFFPPIEK